MNIILQFFFSFVASFSFGILFNIPRKHLIASGITGACAWLTYYILLQGFDINPLLSNFAGAIMLTTFSIIFTKKFRAPIIVFVTCGLIPLVPGGKAYEAVRNIVESDYPKALESGAQAALISFSIAMGIILTEMIYELFRNISNRVKEKHHAS